MSKREKEFHQHMLFFSFSSRMHFCKPQIEYNTDIRKNSFSFFSLFSSLSTKKASSFNEAFSITLSTTHNSSVHPHQLYLNGVIISNGGMFTSKASLVCRFSILYTPCMRPISVCRLHPLTYW